MTKRHPEEVILARWTVDALRVREFAQQTRTRYGDSPFSPRDLLKACDENSRYGLEVVCRDDAVFVGSWCLSFPYNDISDIRLHDTWVQFVMDGGAYDIPVPIAHDGRAEAERIVDYYIRTGREEARLAWEARHAPTLSNRLLDIAEAHPAWVLLGFFFIVIPLVVLVLGLLRGGLR